MVRKHIYFSGRVQGVGFRFQASWAAKRFGLTGWVRNLDDGRVEMEVQGSEQAISDLIACLQGEHFIQIERVVSQEIPVDRKETKFLTRYTC